MGHDVHNGMLAPFCLDYTTFVPWWSIPCCPSSGVAQGPLCHGSLCRSIILEDTVTESGYFNIQRVFTLVPSLSNLFPRRDDAAAGESIVFRWIHFWIHIPDSMRGLKHAWEYMPFSRGCHLNWSHNGLLFESIYRSRKNISVVHKSWLCAINNVCILLSYLLNEIMHLLPNPRFTCRLHIDL